MTTQRCLKLGQHSKPALRRSVLNFAFFPKVFFAAFLAGAALFGASGAFAQENLSVEQLEKLLEEQKMALQEAIANRESTAAKAEDIKKQLADSQERQLSVEDELKQLCEEQEALEPGNLQECMSNLDS